MMRSVVVVVQDFFNGEGNLVARSRLTALETAKAPSETPS